MSNKNNKIRQEVSRWTRIGFLAISILGPVVNTLSSQLRSQTEAAQKNARKQSKQLAKKVVAQSGTVYDTTATQSSKVPETVSNVNNEMIQDLAARSEKAAQELAQRSQQISRSIAKQGTKASKAVKKQSREAAKMVRKQSRKTQHNFKRQMQKAQQRSQYNQRQISPFWAISSFSIGLIAAAVAAYLLIRKRLQQDTVESTNINSSLNGSLNGSHRNADKNTNGNSNTPYIASQPSSLEASVSKPAPSPVTENTGSVASLSELGAENELTSNDSAEDVQATEKMPAISVQATVQVPDKPSDDEDALKAAQEAIPMTTHTLLGIVSTKRYYPIETPLDILHTDGNEQVVYFTDEQDAQNQGYTAAE